MLCKMIVNHHSLVVTIIVIISSHPGTSTPPSYITLPPSYSSSSSPPPDATLPPLLSTITPSFLPGISTDPWPQYIPNMGKGVNISIPHHYSKHQLPSGSLTQVNIGISLYI